MCDCLCVLLCVHGSPLDNTQDQNETHFLEYEPQHMLIKSLDGYYKTTPEKYVDFRGVHPWQNTEDHEDHPSPLLQMDRDLMVYNICIYIYIVG